MRFAASLVGFGFSTQDLDMLVSLYDKINEKKGETNLEDIATIRAEVEQRHQVESTDQNETNRAKNKQLGLYPAIQRLFPNRFNIRKRQVHHKWKCA